LQNELCRLLGLSPTATPEAGISVAIPVSEAEIITALKKAKPKERETLHELSGKHGVAQEKLSVARRKLDEPALRMAGDFEAALGSFATLSRYETTIARSMLSALHELQRLQAARSGKEVAPPEVLDVHISGAEKVAQFNGAAPESLPRTTGLRVIKLGLFRNFVSRELIGDFLGKFEEARADLP
jgi:hypothetical protein